jgi:2-(1,2-epoxy-1,2-dihydrophenyl)acetyl-CoA isomerase
VPDEVTIEREGHVALVGFHRPPDNFFDAELIRQIADAMDEVAGDGSSRAVVLWSEGKHFCAGARITGGADDPTRAPLVLYEQGIRLYRSALPVVAAVQGAAVGGGLGVALAADFRVASPESRFSCNFARLGFHQGFGISVTLPAVIGQQRALELLYTGGQLRGEAALDAGLCDRLAPAGDLRQAATAFAAEIAASGPLAVRAIRRTMRSELADRAWAVMQVESEAQHALEGTADFAEGVRAMAERRTPEWTGR